MIETIRITWGLPGLCFPRLEGLRSDPPAMFNFVKSVVDLFFVNYENLCHEVVDVVLEIVYPCPHVIDSGDDLVRHGLKPGGDERKPEKK